MKIRTEFVYPPIPIRQFDWTAIDNDTYDGAPDSGNRNQIGYGRTEAEAIADLKEQLYLATEAADLAPVIEDDRRAAREDNWFTRNHDSDKAWAERNGGQREHE